MATVLRHKLELRTLQGDFGVQVSGVDISRPLDAGVARELKDAFGRHRVMILRDQDLPPDAHVAFTQHFGECEEHVLNEYHKLQNKLIFELSNIGPDGKPNAVHPDRGTLFWHTDATWRRIPALATLLYAEQAPKQGGNTMFADMIGAYEALGKAEKERYKSMKVVHDLNISRLKAGYQMTEAQIAQVPPIEHPLVAVHPPTGRLTLLLGSHGQEFVGLPPLESRGLFERIMNHCTEPRFVYTHVWKPGDLVMWDNRATMHRATEYDTSLEPRVVRRTVLKGEAEPMVPA